MYRQRIRHLHRLHGRAGLKSMARAATAFAVVLLVIATVSAQTKYPIFTPENFVDTMKTVGVNFAAVNAAVAGKDFATAKAQLVRSRERLALTITFWRDRQKDDAIKILRDSLTKMDDLDTLLSASSVDPVATSALARQIGANCQACHALYREQDPSAHTYAFKRGLVQPQ
jgi:hypothetical protein